MQRPTISSAERGQTIYAGEAEGYTHPAHGAGNVAIAGAGKSFFRRRRMLIASILLVFVIAAGWLVHDSVIYERADEAHVDARILPLGAQINGHVQQVNVVEGQLVHAGDVLAIIDQRPYTIAVAEALANLAYIQNTAATLYFDAAITALSAYTGLSAAQAAVRNNVAEVEAAKHRVQADEVVLKQVQIDASTADAMAALDQQELLQAQSKLAEAVTNLRTAQTAPQRVSLAKAKAQAADSQVLQGQAQLDQAQLNLSWTIIRAPVTGIVGRRRLEVGQSVSVGQDLIDIVSLDDVWITASFKETQIARLRPGQPVEIKIDAYGRTWRGHVTNLGASAGGNHVRTALRVPVRIDFDRPKGHDFNAEGMLKPGLSAESAVRVRRLPPMPPNRLPDGSAPTPPQRAL